MRATVTHVPVFTKLSKKDGPDPRAFHRGFVILLGDFIPVASTAVGAGRPPLDLEPGRPEARRDPSVAPVLFENPQPTPGLS